MTFENLDLSIILDEIKQENGETNQIDTLWLMVFTLLITILISY